MRPTSSVIHPQGRLASHPCGREHLAEGAGHRVQQEKPEEMTRRLLAFLNERGGGKI
jgi:pimeloyl-ACP methyl ester carboxylesterase